MFEQLPDEIITSVENAGVKYIPCVFQAYLFLKTC